MPPTAQSNDYGRYLVNEIPNVISVYPVGFYRDLKQLRRAFQLKDWLGVRHRVRWITRSWRMRSYWNGYLAEVDYPTALLHRTCGHGWTKRRALSSLGRHLGADNSMESRQATTTGGVR